MSLLLFYAFGAELRFLCLHLNFSLFSRLQYNFAIGFSFVKVSPLKLFSIARLLVSAQLGLARARQHTERARIPPTSLSRSSILSHSSLGQEDPQGLGHPSLGPCPRPQGPCVTTKENWKEEETTGAPRPSLWVLGRTWSLTPWLVSSLSPQGELEGGRNWLKHKTEVSDSC